jgi:hypothetical protein
MNFQDWVFFKGTAGRYFWVIENYLEKFLIVTFVMFSFKMEV